MPKALTSLSEPRKHSHFKSNAPMSTLLQVMQHTQNLNARGFFLRVAFELVGQLQQPVLHLVSGLGVCLGSWQPQHGRRNSTKFYSSELRTRNPRCCVFDKRGEFSHLLADFLKFKSWQGAQVYAGHADLLEGPSLSVMKTCMEHTRWFEGPNPRTVASVAALGWGGVPPPSHSTGGVNSPVVPAASPADILQYVLAFAALS